MALSFDIDALPPNLRAAFADWLANNPKAARATITLPPTGKPMGRWGWLRWELDSTQYRAGRLFMLMRKQATGDEGPRTGFNAWDFWLMPDNRSVTEAARRFRK